MYVSRLDHKMGKVLNFESSHTFATILMTRPQKLSKTWGVLRLLAFVFLGTTVGIVLTSLLVPSMIGWYFEPPVEIGINCRPAVDWALDRFLWFQLIGSGAGLALGLVGFFVSRKPRTAHKGSEFSGT